jgi:exodeoxyribonuclease VII small subunit
METDAGFEATLERLERVVEELEGGALGLDAALAKFEEGVRLLSTCHGLLDGAGRRVAVLTGVDASGTPETVAFDAAATAARDASAEPPPPTGTRALGPGGGDDDDIPF